MPIGSIDDALAQLRAGRPVVLVADEQREDGGDLVYAAEHITPDAINFLTSHARGLVCLALSSPQCDRLQLLPQADTNTAALGTEFTVTIDAHPRFGTTTGASARDRARTIQVAIADDARPEDLLRPGHVSPLRARDGGVLVRAGQTEASVDLCRLAGLRPAAVLAAILRDDGEVMPRQELDAFCQRHRLTMCSVADLIRYRLARESFVRRVESVRLPTPWGTFQLHAYECVLDPEPHLALTAGLSLPPANSVESADAIRDVPAQPIDEPVLVRVHRECPLGDTFGDAACRCRSQLDSALRLIQAAGRGALVYLRRPVRMPLPRRPGPTLGHDPTTLTQPTALSPTQLPDRLPGELPCPYAAPLETTPDNPLRGTHRDYGIGSQILRDLGIRKLRILTNRPRPHDDLAAFGLTVVEQVPLT